MNKMLIVVIFIAFIGCIIFLFGIPRKWQPEHSWAGVATALHDLGLSMIVYAEKSVPPDNMTDFVEWWVSQVVEDEEWDCIARSRYLRLDVQNKVINDFWGEPVQLMVNSSGKYTFKSLGPNRKDDNGRMDDIIHERQLVLKQEQPDKDKSTDTADQHHPQQLK